MRRANGEGTIIKLSGKRRRPYAVRITTGWTDEGKQQYKYLGYHANKTDAKNALKEYNLNPYDLIANDITFKALFDLWIEERRDRVAANTFKIYNQSFKKCEPLHNVRFNTLRKTHYQTIINDCSNSVGGKIKSLLNHMYDYAIENDIARTNYAKNLELQPENSTTIDRTIFTEKEIKTLWENINEPFADLVLIMLYSGVRIGEMLTIETDKIDLKNKIMIGGSKTAAGKNRRIPIHNKILTLIKKQYDNGHKYLYVNRNGSAHDPDKFRERHFTKLMKKLNFKHTPHDTRHTFVTRMNNAGVDERIVNLIIGHKNDSLAFDTYTHKTDQQLIDAVNMIE